MSPHLSASQRATVGAVANAIAPPGDHLPFSAADLDVAQQFDDLLGRLDPVARRMMKLLATLVRYGPLTHGWLRTFPNLTREEQEAYLCKTTAVPCWDHDAAVNLRAMCEMLFGTDPRFREHLGDFNAPYKAGVPVPPKTDLPVICHPELHGDTTVDCDVVVVGSGAGGATVAREFAAAGLDVAIVEEGGPVERDDFQDRALNRVSKYCRNSGLTVTLGRPNIAVPMGRAVGGTTVVNSGTCLRTPESVLQDWVQNHGVDMAAPEAMAPRFDELTERLNVQPVADDIMGGNGTVVRRGAEELQLRAHPIPRPTRDCTGSGQCPFGCPRDAKQAMHLTHLPDAVRDGARIYAHCTVTRILKIGRAATGIQAQIHDTHNRNTGHTLTVRAKTVFVCAGALHTPALLMRSGIGKSSNQLGRNLHIHPGSGITGKFAEQVNGWQGVMQSFAIDEYVEEGILLEATFPPLGMSYSAGALPGIGAEHARLMAQYAHMASVGSILSDTSTGRVRILPGLGPTMFYRMNQEDVGRVVRSTAIAARVLFAAGAEEVYPGIPAVPILRSEAEVAQMEQGRWTARDMKVSAYHPMGTARMGADPARAVCDPTGRVHDTDNVYVADTSLFPDTTHVNPQFTLMALCLNIAHRFLDSRAAA